jgi:hypothetical protein
MNSTVWIITALLWFDGITEPKYSEWNTKQFEGKGACLDYVFWNRGELVEGLYDIHSEKDGKPLKTWAFYCEGRNIEFEEV